MNDEQQIRELIERWAAAVHAGEMATVLADHAADIVMFDVLPPFTGVRGIDDYREMWRPFFAWQAQGASFQITELAVTAGADVAFAYALLRCGTPDELAAQPELRLRISFGLVKRDGRWVVQHEHHSFPDLTAGDTDSDANGSDDIRAIHADWFAGTAAKNLDGIMAHIARDVVSYEHEAPLQYVGSDAVRQVCREGLESAAGTVTWEVPDLTVVIRDDLAVAWGLNRMTAEQANGEVIASASRGTRVFQRRNGAWEMIHQHLSYPRDPETGIARTDFRA